MSSNEVLLRFTNGDFASETWDHVMEYLNERHAELMSELCGDLPDRETAKLRGRIGEIDSLRNLQHSVELIRGGSAD